MNRKNVLSALMALIMVISMVALFVFPTGADVDLSKVNPVTAATGASSLAQNFKITTVDELIYAAEHPTYFGDGDVIYLANDLDISTYGESFGADFKNFNPAQDGRTEMNIVFDGLGHTIYNYADDRAFFYGRQVNVIQNLNFVNARVVDKGAGAPTGVILRTVERHVDIFNCHVKDSYCYSTNGGYNGVFVGLVNNGNKSLTIANCSLSNTMVHVDYGGAWASGLFVGRYGSQGSIIMRNCIANNSTLKFKSGTGTNGGGGLMVGEIYNTSYEEIAVFDNIGVFDCVFESGNSHTAPNAIVTTVGKGASTVRVTYDRLYAAGNLESRGDGTYIPIPDLIYNWMGDTLYTSGDEHCTDDTVENVLFHKQDSSQTIPSVNKDPIFSMGAAMLIMNKNAEPEETEPYIDWGIGVDGAPQNLAEGGKAPMKMSFIKDGEEKAYYTNAEGVIYTTDVNYQLLRKDSWKDLNGKNYFAKTLDWTTLSFDKSMTFTAHELMVTCYEDGTHSVICKTENDCVDNHIDAACSGVQIGIQEGGYYGQEAVLYRCSVCGYEWEEVLSYNDPEAPVLVNYAQYGYEIGENVQVGLGVNSNTNLAGFSAYVEYNHAYLKYNNTTVANDAYYCQVNVVDDGLLKIAVVHSDATPVSALTDWLTLNFTATNVITKDTEVPVYVLVEQAVTREEANAAAQNVGDRIQNALDQDATVIYGPFTAGDVDGNGVVELLDAILLIEKLEGTIDLNDDSAFIKRAANVDGDILNEVNTADITYLLRHLADWDGYTLNASAPNPELNGVI